MNQIESEGNSVVSCAEFAAYFDVKLPSDEEEFSRIIEEFVDVGRSCREIVQIADSVKGDTVVQLAQLYDTLSGHGWRQSSSIETEQYHGDR